MRWFKIAAIGVGILIAFLIVGSVIGFIISAVTKLVIAALVVGAVAVADQGGPFPATGLGQEGRARGSRPRLRGVQQAAAAGRRRARCAAAAVPGPARHPRRRRRTGPAQAGDGQLSLYQFASASLVTAAWMPSMRTRAAVRRPITHMVSSAGLPTTVTAGVAFRAVIR